LSEEKIYDDHFDTLMLAIVARLVVRHKLRKKQITLEERASFETKQDKFSFEMNETRVNGIYTMKLW
jgi:hypothetical protein